LAKSKSFLLIYLDICFFFRIFADEYEHCREKDYCKVQKNNTIILKGYTARCLNEHRPLLKRTAGGVCFNIAR